MFSGDDVHTEDGSFHRWLEQLKTGRRLPEVVSTEILFGKDSRSCCANDARRGASQVCLCCFDAEEEFQSLDIEELKGLELHQLMQDKQSVEELGVVLQKLA